MRRYNRQIKTAAIALTLTAAVTGCAGKERLDAELIARQQAEQMTEAPMAVAAGDETQGGEAVETGQALVVIDDEAVPLYSKPAGSNVRTPVASGTTTYGNSLVTIDASNANQGYVMVKYTGSCGKIKVQIANGGGVTYTYNLNARDNYEVFPFSEGNGAYSIKVFENTSGNQYAQAFSQVVNVALTDSFAPFLYPNQYVNFSAGSSAVQKGSEVAASASDQIGVVGNVYDYVVNNVSYDTAKANSVTSGYLPNVDNVLSTKRGICFDYAALMTAMLRSQDIPTKLVVGYTGSLYHAWVNVYIDNVGWVDNMIYFDGQDWKLMDPTFASSGKGDPSIAQYIGDGANYQGKYAY